MEPETGPGVPHGPDSREHAKRRSDHPPASAELSPVKASLVPSVGAEATAWARALSTPTREVREHSDSAKPAERESFLRFLYRGNFTNFGLATAATVISGSVSACAAATASYFGASPAITAWVGAAASYVWYPVYFGLSHYFRDRHLVRELHEQGESHPRARLWGSRITQSAIGESVWLAVLVPGQIFLAQRFGLSPFAAALGTHIPLALSMNIAMISPFRNFSHWLWGLAKPNAGSPRSETAVDSLKID